MTRGGGGQELGADQMALIVLGAIALSVVAARHQSLLADLRGWLRDRSLVLADGHGLVQIPQLGGLDAARVLIVAGLVLVAAVVARFLLRVRRVRGDR